MKSPLRWSKASGSTIQRVRKMLAGIPWSKRQEARQSFGTYHRRGWLGKEGES